MTSLSAANAARLAKCLAKEHREDDGTIRSLGDWIATQHQLGPLMKTTDDGMLNWSRRKFNSLDGRGQDAYEAGLRAMCYYFLNNRLVPKIVWDAE